MPARLICSISEIEISKALKVMKCTNRKRKQLPMVISGDVAWLHLTTICDYRRQRQAPIRL
jgi:hypothetical protein